VQKVNFETTSDLKKDFGHLYEHSPTGSEDLLQFENEDEEEIKKLKLRKTLREIRFGRDVTIKGSKMYMEDKLFNADGNLKSKRDLEINKIVPKVVQLLDPTKKKKAEAQQSSDEDPDPRRAKDKIKQFEDNMRMVDEEIVKMEKPKR
jgi:hypothetical protein